MLINMSVHRSNFTFLWITLAFVLFPALVHGVPLSIADPLEEIVPEEPLPLQKIEVLPTDALSLLLTPEAPLAKEVVVVNEEAPINNLDILTLDQNDFEEKEPINKQGGNEETVVLSVQEKPWIKLLSQEPSEVTYNLIKDETSSPIEKIKPLVLPTTLAPALIEESITTKSKIISEKELLQLKKLKKSTSHKKQALLKILDKIVSEVLIEECNLSLEEVLSATLAEDHEDSTHHLEELEEISPSEKKVLLQRVVKALDHSIKTRDVESPKVENVSSSLENRYRVDIEKPKPTQIYGIAVPNFNSNSHFDKYFLKPSRSVPSIG